MSAKKKNKQDTKENKKKKLYSASFTWKGKVITKRASTKEEAIRKRDEEKFLYEYGLKDLSKDITVKDWTYEWLEKYKKGRVTDHTYRSDRRRMEQYIFPAIGSKHMEDVKQLDLMRILDRMRDQGYSKSAITKVKSCMIQLFNDAIPNDIIKYSPAAGLLTPTNIKDVRCVAMEDKDRLTIINCTSPERLWALFLMFTGARPSEALTVRYDDMIPEYYAVFINGTKTSNAKRYVPLPASVFKELMDTKAHSAGGVYLFSTRTDGMPNARSITNERWARLMNDINISLGCQVYKGHAVPPFKFPDDYVPYDLRHAWFTDLQYSGMPLAMSKMIMGHSLGGVSDRYAHNRAEGAREAYDYIVPYWIKLGFLPASDDLRG